MAQVTYSAGIDHVSGALAKPGKSGQHSCEKMLLATHRVAATTNNKTTRSPSQRSETSPTARKPCSHGIGRSAEPNTMSRMHKACYDSRLCRSMETRLTPAPLPIANSLRLRFTLGTPRSVYGVQCKKFESVKERSPLRGALFLQK